MQMPIESIISGGQTGVDRAALDAALELGLPHAGWCPAGRRAEDGKIPGRYRLRETPGREYLQRTEWNVRDSDATLIINVGRLEGGTAATWQFTRRYDRPCLIIDARQPLPEKEFHDWLRQYDVHRLNVAGPRESRHPGIYEQTKNCLLALLSEP